jgi:hypothetical protein
LKSSFSTLVGAQNGEGMSPKLLISLDLVYGQRFHIMIQHLSLAQATGCSECRQTYADLHTR